MNYRYQSYRIDGWRVLPLILGGFLLAALVIGFLALSAIIGGIVLAIGLAASAIGGLALAIRRHLLRENEMGASGNWRRLEGDDVVVNESREDRHRNANIEDDGVETIEIDEIIEPPRRENR